MRADSAEKREEFPPGLATHKKSPGHNAGAKYLFSAMILS
jgi:hypothetical protein